jgi:hypothetical protein
MTTFLQDESSTEDNQPREYITITIGDPVVDTYRICSGNRDLVVDGLRYTAIPVARTEVSVAAAGQGKDLTLTLPVGHAVVKRYLQLGVPPRSVNVTVKRLQVTSAVSEQLWVGRVTSLAVDGRVAKLRIPSRATETMLRVIPTATVGVECPHILYDTMCRVSRTGSHGGIAHKVTTTAIVVNGREVRVDLGNVARNGTWSQNGELEHAASGERMTIRKQIDTNPGFNAVAKLELQMLIPGLKVGDTVVIYAGCPKDIDTCHTRFNNRQNHGGMPQLPIGGNPFLPGTKGAKP